jgi:hypothetical protein
VTTATPCAYRALHPWNSGTSASRGENGGPLLSLWKSSVGSVSLSDLMAEIVDAGSTPFNNVGQYAVELVACRSDLSMCTCPKDKRSRYAPASTGFSDAPEIYRIRLIGLVGLPGFEPGTSCTPSKRASQAAPQPEFFLFYRTHPQKR